MGNTLNFAIYKQNQNIPTNTVLHSVSYSHDYQQFTKVYRTYLREQKLKFMVLCNFLF